MSRHLTKLSGVYVRALTHPNIRACAAIDIDHETSCENVEAIGRLCYEPHARIIEKQERSYTATSLHAETLQ